uniref:RRM domain-containing protein n=1 Tax=Xiphophorus couchianus TaxID=32473 RepID=A0A3B5LRP8_9TELE
CFCREKMLLNQELSAYAVGQVSGSLFQQSSEPSGSLSALFTTPLPASESLFQPVPKVSTTFVPQPFVFFSLLFICIGFRESSLLTADTDEDVQKSSMRKKRKASEITGENSAEYWVMKRQKQKANKQEEALKMKRTVFVGNLPISCTMKTLQGLFKDKGPIESARFRSVVKKKKKKIRFTIVTLIHPKKQSINAYVVFKNEEGVINALERNGMEIEKGFHIRVDRVTDKSSVRLSKIKLTYGVPKQNIKELAFRQHFEECGKVEAVRLVRDPNSGLGKGFGYVLFESADSVEVALALDGSKLESRSIRVKRSVKKEKQTNKTNSKGSLRKSRQNAVKGSGGAQKPGQANFKPKPSNLSSFKGEMANPNKKNRKVLKKKNKTKKRHRVSTK